MSEKEDYQRLLQMSTSSGSNPKLCVCYTYPPLNYLLLRRLGTAPERPLGGPSDDGSLPIPESNIGHKLLAKMGWKYGQAVGARQEGITEPVKVHLLAVSSVSSFTDLYLRPKQTKDSVDWAFGKSSIHNLTYRRIHRSTIENITTLQIERYDYAPASMRLFLASSRRALFA